MLTCPCGGAAGPDGAGAGAGGRAAGNAHARASSVAYDDCCAPYHRGTPAPTAEKLMRARYSAYVLQDRAFILATWHSTMRPDDLPAEDLQGTRWLGLEVRAHQVDGDQATVEFVARCSVGGRARRMHEVSRFVREVGWWWYLDGSFPKEETR